MNDLPRATPLICPTLVGRERELAALDEVLSRARGGRGRTLRLVGEAGVGKSRLVAEGIARATAQGFRVLRSSCVEPDRARPYAGVIDLLRPEPPPPAPDALLAWLGPLAPHLIGLLPEYAALLPQLVVPPALLPQDEQQRTIQAFVHFIAHQAADAPVLLVVEDLHWSDEASLDVLLALARRAGSHPLLLLTTLRDDQAAGALTAWHITLDRERLAEQLHLERLDYEQTDAMLRAIFDQRQPIRGDFLSALYRLTEGNPFFIEEVLTTLIVRGDIYFADGHWERKPLAELHIPPSVQAAVHLRLAALDPDARRLASLAAVAGRRFDFELLYRLSGGDEVTLLRQIKVLIDAQLVIEESDDRFAFRHALTRAALYAGLLTRERRALHSDIAATLEALANERGAAGREQWAADLATHCFAAGDWARAAQYAQQAAERAGRLYAPTAAVEQLTLAVEALQQLGSSPTAELLRARGHAHETLGAAEAALADYQAALELARASGDRREQWRTMLAIGFYYAARDYARMGEELRAALELARTIDDPLILGQSLNRYGNWHLFLEQPRETLRYHGEALRIFVASGDRAGQATTHDLLGVTHLMGSDKIAAVEHYRQAISLFRQLGDLPGLASALAAVALRGISYYHMTTVPADDSYTAWIRDGEEALQIARQISWRAGEANALVYLALIHGAAGDYRPALERAMAAQELAGEIAHPVWSTGALMARGALALDLLRLTEARALLEQALGSAQALGAFFTRRIAAYLAFACIAQRDLARASEVLAPLLDEATPMETQGQRLNWLARAELALAEGEPQLAHTITGRLIASAVHADVRGAGCVPALWQLHGEALAALGQSDSAEAALRAAAAGAERLRLAPARWRVLRSLGRLYQATGRRTLARQVYAEAHAIVQQLAARIPRDELRTAFHRAAAAMLPRRGAAALPQLPVGATAQLTRREREVATLVAQGMTSREIAAALVLGERTIETHVSSILGKLGFSSRREIAAWAVEVGLARRVE